MILTLTSLTIDRYDIHGNHVADYFPRFSSLVPITSLVIALVVNRLPRQTIHDEYDSFSPSLKGRIVSSLLIVLRSWPFATDADETCQTLHEITFRDI